MKATGKSRFTERILHIAGISPKRPSRPNPFLLLLMPLALCLSSWWPASQAAENPDANWASTFTQDTVPKSKSPTPAKPSSPAKSQKAPLAASPAEMAAPAASSGDTPQAYTPTPTGNVAIEAVRMNVLYIGVDNPIRVAIANVPANELEVQLLGPGVVEGSDGNYIARVTTPGEVTIRVLRRVAGKTEQVVDQKYRVKRIPDPTPMVDFKHISKSIRAEELRTSKGVNAVLVNFDFDAYCEVTGFEFTYLPKGGNPTSWYNVGAQWDKNTQDILATIAPGGAIFVDDIKIKCPGDAAPRHVGGLAFKLKED